MFQIPNGKLRDWAITNPGKVFVPKTMEIECPKCRASLVNLNWQWKTTPEMVKSGYAYGEAVCRGCEQSVRIWILDPSTPGNDLEGRPRVFIDPTPQTYPEDWERVKKEYPRFAEIYDQAARSEGYGLDELSGMGFRKALEFLVKHYACDHHSGEENKIKKMFLDACINKYIDDTRISAAAKRANWIGNDETHFEKRYEDKDINDMKRLLSIVVHRVSMDLELKDYEEEMPSPK